MMRLTRCAALLFTLVLVGHSASAATVSWEGTLSLNFNSIHSFKFIDTGVATTGVGVIDSLQFGSVFSFATTVPLTDPNVPELVTLTMAGGFGGGTLGPVSGVPLTAGAVPLHGNIKLCILTFGCGFFIDLPLTVGGTRGVGLGGQITVNGFGKGTHVSVEGSPWTVGATSISAFTTNAMIPGVSRAVGPKSIVGFVHAAASGSTIETERSGLVQFVTATQISTNLNDPLSLLPLLSTVTFRFTPEPATGFLIGSGVVILAVMGRRGRRYPPRS